MMQLTYSQSGTIASAGELNFYAQVGETHFPVDYGCVCFVARAVSS